MLNITQNSGTITAPIKVRFYYSTAEVNSDSTWIVGSSNVNEPILLDSTWTWFKFEGTIANVISNFSASGLPMGDGTTANTMTKLIPDEMGVEDGVKYVQFNYITNFSTFGYQQTFVKNNNASVLPLNLLSFSASLKGTTTNLYWSTSSEDNVKNFTLERSINGGLSFNTIFIKNANGGTLLNEYAEYDDVSGLKGKILYRLKVTDIDGKFTYSKIEIVNVTVQLKSITVSPNPFTNKIIVNVSSTNSEVLSTKILSMDGKLMYVANNLSQIGNNIYSINTNTFIAGTYILQIKHEDGLVEQTKIICIK